METRLINPNACKFIQSRVLLDPATVAEYAEMMDNGVSFEPCKGIITDAGAILVYDGNHRGEAAKTNGSMLEVELTRGTEQDAEWRAYSANARHGLRRSKDDIASAVKHALRHPTAIGKSDREIARHCGCDHKTVGKYRKELEASGERPQMPERTVQRNGQEYQMTIPTPETIPGRNGKGEIIDRAIITVPCEDCGKDFDKPADRADLTRCEPCRFEQYRKKHAPRPEEVHAGSEKLREVHERLGLIPPDPQEPDDLKCAYCGDDAIYLTPSNPDKSGIKCTICQVFWAQREDYDQDMEKRRQQPEACQACYADRPHWQCAFRCCNTCDVPPEKCPFPSHASCRLERLLGCPECHGTSTVLWRPNTPLRCKDCGELWATYDHYMTAQEEDVEQCDFCGKEYPEDKLYQDSNETTVVDFYICLSCAQKALHALLDPSDPDIIAEAQQIEREIMQPTGALPEPT